MKNKFLDKSFLPLVLEHFLNHIPLEKWLLDLWLRNGKINANMCLLSHFGHNLQNKTWNVMNQIFLSSLEQYQSNARNLTCRSGP